MGDRPARPDPEGGFVTVEYIVAVAMSLVVLVAIANFIVFEYGQSVVRSAVDQGVREGARAPGPPEVQRDACQKAAQQVINDLLGGSSGSMGGGVVINCTVPAGAVDASAQARFAAWLRPFPNLTFTTTATAAVEPSG
jgi:hypothetical protein